MNSDIDEILDNLHSRVAKAVSSYWSTRESQAKKQVSSGRADQGLRGAVTGGAQMDGFITLLSDIIRRVGVSESDIFYHRYLELPGFFRPTKEWDLLVVQDGQLLIALEAKSQVGPSFGNNFNNRTEEAMGSALDLWTAYREGAFNRTIRPWLGYMFLLENCKESRAPVRVKEPHFEVFKEFKDASYAKRYELFCRKLMRERLYNCSAFLMSTRTEGLNGIYAEPAEDLTFELYTRSLIAHVSAFRKK
ncbi:MAG: PaeR7I family type II restriction endonuclease [Nitrospirota bacterium]